MSAAMLRSITPAEWNGFTLITTLAYYLKFMDKSLLLGKVPFSEIYNSDSSRKEPFVKRFGVNKV
jgi:hypothetical protein